MSDFRPGKSRTGRRKPGSRQLAKRILVVCGGRKTEITYLDGLRIWARNAAVKLTFKGDGRAPEQVVDLAYGMWVEDRDAFDEVWVVLDEDDFDLAPALVKARRRKIRLAFSKPCFELWLLLHFQECGGRLDNYKAVEAKLKKHLPRYDKSDLKFPDYRDYVADAHRRAKKLDMNHPEGDAENPSTGVWRLVSEMYPKVRDSTQ